MEKTARLILLRHAKSDWEGGIHKDKDRVLSARGRKAAPRMGKWLAQQGFIPDLILCSSAVRTRQTISAVNEFLRLSDACIIHSDALYLASCDDLLDLLGQYKETYNSILISGHNPGLEELLCFLCDSPPVHSTTGKLLATATAAVLSYPASDISITAHSASLVDIMRPRELPVTI